MEAGVETLCLDGCTECNKFIFLPQDDRSRCPWCDAERYHPSGEPKERVWYFPIRKRLEALMKLVPFAKSINHEKNRPFNDNFLTDVYDTPAWKHETGQDDPDSDYFCDGV